LYFTIEAVGLLKCGMGFVVYILRTSGGTFYVGYTNDLEKRLKAHRSKSGRGAKYLRMFPSFELVHQENYETKSEAMKRESEIKKMSHAQKRVVVGLRDETK